MANITTSTAQAIELAKQLTPNITIENGQNWIWALGFDSKEKAEEFSAYCEIHDCQTKGVYENKVEGLYDVKFR